MKRWFLVPMLGALLACQPPTQGIDLPIPEDTRAAVLAVFRDGTPAAGPELFALDLYGGASEPSEQLQTADLTDATKLELALYRCDLLELGLARGRLQAEESGEPLPPTRCGLSRPLTEDGEGERWSLEPSTTLALQQVRVARSAGDCFPARVDPSCSWSGAPGEDVLWDAPRTGLEVLGSGRRGLLKLEVPREYAWFGQVLAIDDKTLVVGRPGDSACGKGVGSAEGDDSCPGAGAAYVYRWSPSGWLREAYLKPSNTHTGQEFGRSVAVSGDTILIGAHRDAACASGINGSQVQLVCQSFGAAFVFRRTSEGWRQEAFLKASTPTVADWFGSSVALSGDVAIVGASGQDSCGEGPSRDESPSGCTDSGALYQFRRSGTTWRQEWILKSMHPEVYAGVGLKLSFEKDLLVASTVSRESCRAAVEERGFPSPCLRSSMVEVFRAGEQGGWTWIKAIDVIPDHTQLGALGGVVTDGSRVFVGQPWEFLCSETSSTGGSRTCDEVGAVSIFGGASDLFELEQRIVPSAPYRYMEFGLALAVSRDTLVVGAPGFGECRETSPGGWNCVRSGAAYGFRRGPNGFELEAEFRSERPWPHLARFSSSIALQDGFLAIGAPSDPFCRAESDDEPDLEDCPNSGAVHTYDP